MFELISRDKVLVSRKNPADQCKTITITGELAKIDDRLVGRSRIWDRDLAVWQYGGFDEATGQASLAKPTFLPATFFDAKRQIIDNAHGLHTMPPSPDDVEFAVFAKTFPAVARKLGIRPSSEEPGLFPTGKVEFPKSHCPALDGPNGLRHYLALFRSGDFGLCGRHDLTPLSDQEAYMVGELSVSRANDATIAMQYGAVRASYDSATHDGLLSILTILAGPGTRTLIFMGGF